MEEPVLVVRCVPGGIQDVQAGTSTRVRIDQSQGRDMSGPVKFRQPGTSAVAILGSHAHVSGRGLHHLCTDPVEHLRKLGLTLDFLGRLTTKKPRWCSWCRIT